MEVDSASPMALHQTFKSGSVTQCGEISAKFMEDFCAKLNISPQAAETQIEVKGREQEKDQDDNHEEKAAGEDEEEEDFSFVCVNPEGSPISADDIFQNGQIRPIFPLFDRDLLFADDGEGEKSSAALRLPLKKLFVEESSTSSSYSEADGPQCGWRGKAMEALSSTEVVCKKSNSTGFSKLRRFREFVLRSNSDGKDAFVFLNPDYNDNNNNNHNTASTSSSKKEEKNKKKELKEKGKKRGETVSSAHERHYIRNRAVKEGTKRKSYLPYRQVGFFTNVNGLSRNVHPF